MNTMKTFIVTIHTTHPSQNFASTWDDVEVSAETEAQARQLTQATLGAWSAISSVREVA